MEYREFPPSGPLRPFVECLWHLRTEVGGTWHSLYPDACTELLFNLGEPADESGVCGTLKQPRYCAYGTFDERIQVRNQTGAEVLAIRFRPAGAAPVLGVPAWAITDRAIALDSIAPELAGRLISIAESEAPVKLKLAQFDRCLQRWIRSKGLEVAATSQIARYLQMTPDADTNDLELLTGWSARTAQRRFRSDVGLTPKRFLQVSRFLRLLRLFELEPETPLSQIAVAAGYFDQPHLHRDFCRFTGTTPAVYRAKRREAFDLLYGGERLERIVAV